MSAGAAFGATEVQIDVNGLTATASGGVFNQFFTGTLTLAHDSNSSVAGVLRDGVSGAGFTGPFVNTGASTNMNFAATFTFNNGDITGVGLSVGVSSANNMVIDNTYAASVGPGLGNIDTDKGKAGDFLITARTFGGVFNAATFGGVSVAEFFGFSNPGNFINFKVSGPGKLNGENRSDDDVDIDVFVRPIPLPSAAALAGVGLLGVAGLRRRRVG
ncbi:MAG TPA: hypothetical protein DEB06_11820 [Phycisphaerales bacterium]|nr:hypothetical protein [Phycisphaerales bacterium]